jgi:hypothetical protein
MGETNGAHFSFPKKRLHQVCGAFRRSFMASAANKWTVQDCHLASEVMRLRNGSGSRNIRYYRTFLDVATPDAYSERIKTRIECMFSRFLTQD